MNRAIWRPGTASITPFPTSHSHALPRFMWLNAIRALAHDGLPLGFGLASSLYRYLPSAQPTRRSNQQCTLPHSASPLVISHRIIRNTFRPRQPLPSVDEAPLPFLSSLPSVPWRPRADYHLRTCLRKNLARKSPSLTSGSSSQRVTYPFAAVPQRQISIFSHSDDEFVPLTR